MSNYNRGKRTPMKNRVVKRRKEHAKLDSIRDNKDHIMSEVHEDHSSGIATTYQVEYNPLVHASSGVNLDAQKMPNNIQRRILISKSTVGEHLAQHVVKGYTTPVDIIDDVYSIIGIEIRKFRNKALSQEEPLDVMDAQKVTKYGETLAKLTKAEQQLATTDELDSMTQEQLEYTVLEMSRRAGILTDEHIQAQLEAKNDNKDGK